jgi:hypothetical protein
MTPTVAPSGAPKRPSFRSRSWTIRARQPYGSLLNAKQRAEGFERATLALVAELDSEHVERDGPVGKSFPVRGEVESCVRIDEAANEPRGGYAIALDSLTL